jgi:cell division protein FtsB
VASSRSSSDIPLAKASKKCYIEPMIDNLFYRKHDRKNNVWHLFKKSLKNKRTVAGVVVGLPLTLFLLFGSHGIVQRIKLVRARADLESKIQQAAEETRQLQGESKALDGDKKAIEKVAREKYGMIRDGETVYKATQKK